MFFTFLQYKFDFVESFEAKAFSLKIEPEENGDDQNNDIIINIDGDPFAIKSNETIHVKMHANMMNIYGPSANWHKIRELM